MGFRDVGGYKTRHGEITRAHPKGSRERAEALAALRREQEAEAFKTTGDRTLIDFLQKEAATRYSRLIILFYAGKMEQKEYLRRRVEDVSVWYATELVRHGLADGRFTREWFDRYAATSWAEEQKLATPKRSGLTLAEMESLCGCLYQLGRTFYAEFHAAFGRGLLKEKPEEYLWTGI